MRKPQGFAAMTPERQKEIAAMGGRAIKPKNRTYSRDQDLAREAGRKGGLATRARKREKQND
jgi:general stress protein YciG